MATTVQQVIDIARAVSHDTGASKWFDNTALIPFVDEGHKRFSALAPQNQTRELLTISTGTLAAPSADFGYSVTAISSFSIPGIIAVRAIAARTGATGNTKYLPMDELTVEEFYAALHHSGTGGQGRPDASAWTVADNSIWSKGHAATALARAVVTRIPPTLTLVGDFLIVNDAHAYCIADWVLHRMFARLASQRSLLYLESFGQYIAGIGGRWAGMTKIDKRPVEVGA